MSNPTIRPEDVPAPEEALKWVSSRYNLIPQVRDPYSNYSTLGLYRRNTDFYRNQNGSKYYEVTPSTEFRPDLISYNAYEDSSYWWIIMEANNLGSVDQIKTGMTLLIPRLEVILNLTNDQEDIFA